jgi:hypothetical protein
MAPSRSRIAAAALSVVMLTVATSQGFAQSGGDAKPAEPQKQTTPDPAKDRQRRLAEYAEAFKALNGPAGNQECVWLGRRVVSLMWRDDLDTAFRHLDLYDRFGCPGGHIQATFRCMVRLGDIDPKQTASVNDRVHACWINPEQASETPQPATAAPAAAPPPAAPAPAAPPAEKR